jgi:hypothetical protein
MERRGTYRVLVGKLEGMSPLGSKSNPVTGPVVAQREVEV